MIWVDSLTYILITDDYQTIVAVTFRGTQWTVYIIMSDINTQNWSALKRKEIMPTEKQMWHKRPFANCVMNPTGMENCYF